MRAARAEPCGMKTMRSIAVLALLGALTAMPAARADVRYLDEIFPVVDITSGTQYGQATNNLNEVQPLLLDLYTPNGDTEIGRPAIVLAHGGGFTGGARNEGSIFNLAASFARRGFVTASISYRIRPPGTPGSPTVPDLVVGSVAGQMPQAMRDAQHDMQAAVRWMRANAEALGIDPNLIIAGGISAGASMALEAAFNPDDPGDSGTPNESSAIAAALSLSGATDPRRIEAGAPPVAMFHGTNDTTAPYPTAVMACATTIAMLNRCQLTTYPGDGHDLRPRHAEIVELSSAFVCAVLLEGCG